MRLQCKIGMFYFPKGTLLSHAKSIRDAVMGQLLAPKQNQQRLSDEDSCYEFMRNHDSKVISEIPFELILR